MEADKISVSDKNMVFIVGTPRSGTTLMSQILNKHSDVWIAKETHYFEDLRMKMAGREQQILNSEEVKLTEDYFLALTHKSYGVKSDPEQGWMKRIELRTLAQQIGRGTDSYFEAFCQLCAQRMNKTRFGEKTPRHIFQLSTIFSLYPNAQVICMVRHPGGVLASSRDWKNVATDSSQKRRLTDSYNLALNSLHWRAAFNAAMEARKQFGESRIFIQRFEDLVTEPEATLQALTAWLSLEYQPSMLDVDLVNSSYSSAWRQPGVGLSCEPAYRWRDKLSPTEIGSLQTFCGNLLSKAGYDYEQVSASYALVVWFWMILPFAGIRSLSANRSRMSNIPNYVWRRLRLTLS